MPGNMGSFMGHSGDIAMKTVIVHDAANFPDSVCPIPYIRVI
jgi:hypothetical protein